MGDFNKYITGRMGRHHVVVTLLGNIGTASAAGSATTIRMTWKAIKLAFLVGICGGVPSTTKGEVLLGDVVVSTSILHGVAKQYERGWEHKDTLDENPGRPNKDVRSLLKYLTTGYGAELLHRHAGECLENLQRAEAKYQRLEYSYRYPGAIKDMLFPVAYRHQHRGACVDCGENSTRLCRGALIADCAALGCDPTQLVPRQRLEAKRKMAPGHEEVVQRPEIFFGRIASRDVVLKSAKDRDRIAREHNVIAFEMEGGGVWDELPCVIVKGVSDYADAHKSDVWQPFAAATAASVMKSVLRQYTCSDDMF